ncbi:MAG: MBL fold metallo-hydrolase [Paracoccaceae bacterium]
MRITRRRFLAAGAAAGLLPRPIWARTSVSGAQWQLDTLSDGSLTLPYSFLTVDPPDATSAEILARHGIAEGQPITPPCNLTLWRDGVNTVLFDAGAGPDFMPSAGKLSEAFDALDVSVEDVTHVVFTHAHPDHLWGVLDDFDEPVFVNATHMIGGVEHDYWMDPATADTIGEARAAFAAGAKRRLEMLEDIIVTFGDGEEILPGVTAVMTPGHTPGHMALRLGGDTESVMVLGDCIGNAHLAFEAPDVLAGSDQDPGVAAMTRRALLDRLAGENQLFVGFHLPEGGIGRAVANASAYRFVPEAG